MNQPERAEITAPVAKRDPFRRRALRRLWRAQTIYALVLVIFTVLALFAHLYAYFAWDVHLARFVQTLPGVRGLMLAASTFGNGIVPWALTSITILLFLIFRRRSEAAALLLSAGGGELVNRLLKLFIGRPRPTAEHVMILATPKTESFPSGHVTFYVCFFGFLFFTAFALLRPGSLLRRLALALCLLPILLVGLSRIYLGAHWPSDVLGAYLFSGLWLAFSVQMYQHWKRRLTLHPEEKSETEERA